MFRLLAHEKNFNCFSGLVMGTGTGIPGEYGGKGMDRVFCTQGHTHTHTRHTRTLHGGYTEDPRKCPWNPYPKAPNFYPDVFGKFLSGKRIWVPTWAIFIRTPDMAFSAPRQTSRMTSPEFNFLSFTWFRESESCINIIHLRHYYSTISTI